MINESGTNIETQESKEKVLAYVVGGEVGSYQDGTFVPVSGPAPSPATEHITVEVDVNDSSPGISITYAELYNAAIEKHLPVYLIVKEGDDQMCGGYASVNQEVTRERINVNLTLLWFYHNTYVEESIPCVGLKATTVHVANGTVGDTQAFSVETFDVFTHEPD